MTVSLTKPEDEWLHEVKRSFRFISLLMAFMVFIVLPYAAGLMIYRHEYSQAFEFFAPEVVCFCSLTMVTWQGWRRNWLNPPKPIRLLFSTVLTRFSLLSTPLPDTRGVNLVKRNATSGSNPSD